MNLVRSSSSFWKAGTASFWSSRVLVMMGIVFYIVGLFGVAGELRRWDVFSPEPSEKMLQEGGFTTILGIDEQLVGFPDPGEIGSIGGSGAVQNSISADIQSFPERRLTRSIGVWDYSDAREQIDPLPAARIPDQIIITSIGLSAPIVPVENLEVQINGETLRQWIAPLEYTVGWHNSSATLGRPGNTVLNGHHNYAGEVFRDLEDVRVGDLIFLLSGEQRFIYRVEKKLLLKERWEPLEVRQLNARWIQPTSDERLTLVTCWPYESNTHRVVVVAKPARLRTTHWAGGVDFD